MKLTYFCSAMVAMSLVLVGCGVSDDDTTDTEKDVSTKKNLVGPYGADIKMNGYDVRSEITLDPEGNYLGIAFNTLSTNQPSKVFTIVKGNIDNLPLREFDIVNKSINSYEAKATRLSQKDIRFSYRKVPSDLTRPTELTVSRLSSPIIKINQLAGNYPTSSVSVVDPKQNSRTVIQKTQDPHQLTMTVSLDGGCKLDATITKQSYQSTWFDTSGSFSGINCSYAGQEFEGLTSYDIKTRGPVVYGTNTNNTNAFVTAVTP